MIVRVLWVVHAKKKVKRPPPVTLRRLKKWLLAEHNVHCSRPQLQKKLKKAGLRFGRGVRVYNGHEAAANVAYRHQYAKRMVEFRTNRTNKRHLPSKPMIVLDETYLNENHDPQF